VDDHNDAISKFQKESDSGSDAAIKGFATRTLPTLQGHLTMARDTSNKVNASSSSPR
jgi:putative membrane protein